MIQRCWRSSGTKRPECGEPRWRLTVSSPYLCVRSQCAHPPFCCYKTPIQRTLVEARLPLLVEYLQEFLGKLIPHPFFRPAPQSVVDGTTTTGLARNACCILLCLREIFLPYPRLEPVDDAVQHLSIVPPAASGRGLGWQQRFENLPLLIGESSVAHSSTLFTYSSFYAFLDYFMFQQTSNLSYGINRLRP